MTLNFKRMMYSISRFLFVLFVVNDVCCSKFDINSNTNCFKFYLSPFVQSGRKNVESIFARVSETLIYDIANGNWPYKNRKIKRFQ